MDQLVLLDHRALREQKVILEPKDQQAPLDLLDLLELKAPRETSVLRVQPAHKELRDRKATLEKQGLQVKQV